MKRLPEILVLPKTYSKLLLLYPEDIANKEARKLGRFKEKILILAIAITLIATVGLYLVDNQKTRINSISRNTYGMGDKQVKALVDIDNLGEMHEIQITVKDKVYDQKELDEYFIKAQEIIWEELLGSNESLDEVTDDLDLINHIDGLPFSISWKSEKPLLLSSKGIIDKKAVKDELARTGEKSVVVRLIATLRYEDSSQDIYGYVCLREDRTKNIDTFKESLLEQIEEDGNRTRQLDEQELPPKVNGVKVDYYEKSNNRALIVFVLGTIISILLLGLKDNEIDEEIKKRDKQLIEDYPKILNQYVLYYCAGMNTKAIWEEICLRYERRINNGEDKSWAYEEMVRCKRAMNEGEGEITAYNDFAKRCQMPSYRTFVSLIEQSVKKGNERLNIALEEELERARREENNRVRMIIAEMSTKLLVPMIMMLIIVLVIVMVPAFISFNN